MYCNPILADRLSLLLQTLNHLLQSSLHSWLLFLRLWRISSIVAASLCQGCLLVGISSVIPPLCPGGRAWPEAAVEAEAKFIEAALQTLIAQTMVGSQKEGLQIGNQGVCPAQNAAVLIKDLVMVDISLAQRCAKSPEGIAVDFTVRANVALGNRAA